MLMREENKQLCDKMGEGWMGQMKMKDNMGKIFVNFGAPISAYLWQNSQMAKTGQNLVFSILWGAWKSAPPSVVAVVTNIRYGWGVDEDEEDE